MKTKHFFLFAALTFILLFTTAVQAQAPDTLWTQTYGGDNEEQCHSLIYTTDGCYVLGGTTQSFGSGGRDSWLVKTDEDGDTLWTRTYGGIGEDTGMEAIETSDGGYAFIGYSTTYTYGENDIWLVKTDSNGDMQWNQHYGGIGMDNGFGIVQTTDEGYAIAGEFNHAAPSQGEFWVLKVSSSGDSLWSFLYHDSPTYETAKAIIKTPDNEIIAAGYPGRIVKLSSDGTTIWNYTYGGIEFRDLINTSEGNYAALGYGGGDWRLVKVDQTGTIQINKSYGSEGNDGGYGITQMPDNGYVLVGEFETTPSQNDMVMIRTNENGDSLWSYTLGVGAIDYGKSIVHTPDFGYAVAGFTGAWGVANYWLIKFEPENNLSGPLSGTLDPGTYIVTDDISVQSGDSLIIEPGVTFLFDGEYEFDINGYLYAVGTEADSIKFMPNEPDSSWGGLDFNDSADDGSELGYCLITGSNSSGIDCNTSSPAITNCTISGNTASEDGGGIYCYYSSPTIENCTISGNSAFLGGGIYCSENSSTIISRCSIFENSSNDNGGGIACENSSSPTIENCTISRNSSGTNGGGICCWYSVSTIINTIIEGNIGNGGIYFNNSPNASITYGDFYDNENGNLTGSPPAGLGTITTTNANGDSCDVYYNIFLDPLFQTTTGDSAYYLTAGSPCIDTGNPDPIYFDPDGTVADMGCYYFHQEAVLSGLLSGTLTAGEYHVTDNISVQSGDSLIIEPGAILLFDGDYSFDINGYLYAVGTETDSIKFMPNELDTDWGGIDFNDSADDDSELGYCYITGSNSSGIYCGSSSPTISNCTISENTAGSNGGGIYCQSSSPIISGNTISGNSTGSHGSGGGICCTNNSDPTISGNTISGNSANYYGGGIYCSSSSPTIIGNTISDNSTGSYHGGGIYCTGSNPTISGNTISENTAGANGGGIYCESNSNPTISGNTISGNSASDGGGISCSGSNPTIINTIIEGNTGNGGIYFDNSSNSSVGYCDFYNNENGNFTGDPPASLGTTTTTNANGDSCDVFFNIFLDPLFYSTTGDSAFQLTANSPCIDAGDPDPQYYDPDGTIADMGAYYYDQQLEYPNSIEITGEIDTGAGLYLLDDGNLAALDVNAIDDYDPGIDIPKPAPPPNDYLSVYFPHPEWGVPTGDNFMVDARNNNDDLIDDIKIYEFEIITDLAGEEVNLTFTIGDEYPANYGAVLYDADADSFRNLRENNQYGYTAGVDPGDFIIFLGDGTPPVITFTCPTPDTQFVVNNPCELIWNCDDVSEIRHSVVSYSLDNGSSWTLIDTALGSSFSLLWTPESVSDSAKIKVEAEDWPGNLGSQESAAFTIIAGDPPTVEIIFPAADELLFFDTSYDLSWTTTPGGAGIDFTVLNYSLDDGADWTFIDTIFAVADDTYPWIPPSSFSVYAKLRVSATDSSGLTGIAVSDAFNIAPNYMENDFAAAWHLFSIPLIPEYTAIDSIFGDDITGPFFVYSYSHLGGYSLLDTLEHGYGYWLALMEATAVDIDGMPEVDSTYTDLLESWNIVGSAIPTQVPKDSLRFTDGISIVSFSDAVDSGWVMPAFYEYDNFIGDYILTDTLVPWGGYWLNVLSDNIQMITYPPYPAILDLIASGEGERQDESALNWLAPVILHQGELANVIAGFGMHSEAADGFDIWHDVHLPPTPPSGNYVRVVYDHPEWNAPGGVRFVRDIRAIFDESGDIPQVKEWDFLIEASDPGEITVNFQNFDKHLPEGYSAVAAYITTVLDLMETHTFSFEYTDPLDVTVKVFNQAATILGWNTDELNGSLPAEYCLKSVYPNPFNPTATIRIGLPEASDVKITVYNIIGREVWKYDSGIMNAGYHNITFNAGNLSSGIYFVRAVVPGKMREMRKIVLVK